MLKKHPFLSYLFLHAVAKQLLIATNRLLPTSIAYILEGYSTP
ncbi:hypothetical protein DB29_03397 [Shouchella clausii]|nr:hypothetical protein DB29_03397 [Shouchella clausii]